MSHVLGFGKVKTLTKAQLVQLLNGVNDDELVYFLVIPPVLEMAQSGLPDGPKDLYFGISSSSQGEVGGVTLLADIRSF